MLNIIVPYSPRVLLIEIWSDWTQTRLYKGRCIKTEARLLRGRQNICMWRYFLFILFFEDFNKTVHLDSMPILWSFSLGNRLTFDWKSDRCLLRFQVGQHISGRAQYSFWKSCSFIRNEQLFLIKVALCSFSTPKLRFQKTFHWLLMGRTAPLPMTQRPVYGNITLVACLAPFALQQHFTRQHQRFCLMLAGPFWHYGWWECIMYFFSPLLMMLCRCQLVNRCTFMQTGQ